MVLLPAAGFALEVTRGPYLQLGTPTAMTIRWRTDQPAACRVLLGTAMETLSAAAESFSPATEHEITLTGLAPGQRYYYAVADAVTAAVIAGGDAGHWFATPPPPGAGAPVRIWVIGDSGTADDGAAAVRDAFRSYSEGRPPDLWLMLGDNAYDSGTDREYQAAVFDMYPELLRSSVLWPARGNHDASASVYFGAFTLPEAAEAGGVASGTEAYYSFDHGDVHFVCLDSEGSSRSATGPMASWLRDDLAATTRPWIIAYWHHPPYSKGSHDSDDESELVAMRRNIVPILETGGVDLVLTGHSHSYERSCLLDGHHGVSGSLTAAMKLDAGDGREGGNGAYRKRASGGRANLGAVYAVVGSSGRASGGELDHPAMVRSLDEPGSMVIDIVANRLDARFIDDAGVVRDEFTIVKPLPPRIEVLAPNGGEGWNAWSTREIRWTATDDMGVTAIDVFWSPDGGATWQTVVAGLPNSGSYTWILPGTPVDRALVAVKAFDADGMVTTDFGDAVFEIRQPDPPSPDRALTRGPYLQRATPGAMTVRWRTPQPALGRLLYGPTQQSLSVAAEDRPPATDHEVTISGLEPGRTFHYAVADGDGLVAGGGETHRFTTTPLATREPIRVWVIGNSGTGDGRARDVRDAFTDYSRGVPPDVWLMLGDNANPEGSDEDYQSAVFEMYPELLATSVLWPTRGRNDRSLEVYRDIFTLPMAGESGGAPSGTEAYYSFDHGGVHFVSLDSEGSPRSATGAMANWLRQDLAGAHHEWIIAYFHHPPYSKGSRDSDDDSESGGRLVDMRENIVPILEARGVDLVLSAHSQSYERSCLLNGHYGESSTLTADMKLDAGDGSEDGDGAYRKAYFGAMGDRGTVYAVVGSSGRTGGGRLDHPAMVRSVNARGSLVIDISGHRLDARFIDDSGDERDRFTILKVPGRPRAVPLGPEPQIALGGSSPFLARVPIRYMVPVAGPTSLAVFAIDGRRVAQLVDRERPSGWHMAEWDGRDAAGGRAHPGIYFAELRWRGVRRVIRLAKLE